jgi:hypothetical protein
MATRYWIQVRPDGVICGKQSDNGKNPAPSNPPNRMIRVDQDMYEKCLHNIDDAAGQYILYRHFRLDETALPVEERTKEEDAKVNVKRAFIVDLVPPD